MRRSARAKLGAGAFLVMVLASGCALIVSTSDLTGGVTGSPDGASSDGASGVDSSSPTDGGIDADAVSYTYNDFTDPTKWASFELSEIDAGATSYSGAVSDGRYVYLAPYQTSQFSTMVFTGVLQRIDLTADFTSISAWSTFDIGTVSANAVGFNGAVFDGQYVYFSPSRNASGNYSGLVARYDTHASLTDTTSWATFDTQPLASDANGYAAGGFDGRYVYLGPQYGETARFDTKEPFGTSASWTVVKAETIAGSASGSLSGAFYDGARYLYFLPAGLASPNDALRYDTHGSITDGSAWKRFDVTPFGTVRGAAAAFDGRYMYISPIIDSSGNYSGIFLRYDTTGDFASASAWSSFDLTTLDSLAAGFAYADFDGRYVYFAPYSNDHLARYDTTASFTDKTSWKTIPLQTIRPNAQQMGVTYFDGRYMYFFPGGIYYDVALRFDARTPN